MTLLLKLDNLIEGIVCKRPSKYIKTPYVADIKICSDDNMILGHTASLGCCGLSDVNSRVLMAPIPKTKKRNDKLQCEYRVYLSIVHDSTRNMETIVGINPKLAETITESALNKNLLCNLKNIRSYRKETPIYVKGLVDSRFDFTGIDENDIPFILEVKNVPLADYEDVTAKERKKMCFDDRDYCSKVAYFPDGYRKSTNEPVSPRALKHMSELTTIKRMSKTRCIMCYVVQRTDVDRFQPSVIDPQYRAAFMEAQAAGVEMIVMVVKWTREGEAYFICDNLRINL